VLLFSDIIILLYWYYYTDVLTRCIMGLVIHLSICPMQ